MALDMSVEMAMLEECLDSSLIIVEILVMSTYAQAKGCLAEC